MNIEEFAKQAFDESMAFTRYLTEKYGVEKGMKIMDVVADMGRIAQDSGVAEASFQEFPRFAAGMLRVARGVSGKPHPTVAALSAISTDPEQGHCEAEGILLNLLRDLGHEEVAKAFEEARDRVEFWYA